MATEQTAISRRSVLEGLGIGALGLTGAALLGCGGGSSKGGGQIAADKSGQVVGATSGGGLPMNRPVVEGKIREGGTFIAGGATGVQHDPHTALAGNVWHYIGEIGRAHV